MKITQRRVAGVACLLMAVLTLCLPAKAHAAAPAPTGSHARIAQNHQPCVNTTEFWRLGHRAGAQGMPRWKIEQQLEVTGLGVPEYVEVFSVTAIFYPTCSDVPAGVRYGLVFRGNNDVASRVGGFVETIAVGPAL